jgi:hypothetical protein
MIIRWNTTILPCLLAASLLAACSESTLNVNLHGVNYSGETFSYAVGDPATPDQLSGGELIDPFGAGGTTCCASLPKEWRPGIKLHVRTTYWTEGRVNGENKISEFKNVRVVDVPPYVEGKPGELWVLREADGGVSVVSSDFQPDHPKWPGKVKGWPVPSLAYQRERWELYRKHEQGGVDLFSSLLKQLKDSPEAHAREAWEYAKKNDPSEIKDFSGPDDPRYVVFLREDYKLSLERSKLLLENVMKARP